MKYVDEVDDLLARLGVAERGEPEVVLAGLEARDDGVERRIDEIGLQSHHARDGVAEIGAHALDGVAVGADELVRRISSVGCDGQGPFGLDLRRDFRSDCGVHRDGGRGRRGAGRGRGTLLAAAAAARGEEGKEEDEGACQRSQLRA